MKRWVPYAVSAAAMLALAPFFVHDWDGFVFLRSARDFLAGTTPYETAQQAPSWIFLSEQWPPVNEWYAYPPLALLLYAPFVGLASLTSSDPMLARVALKVPFIVGTLALGWVGGALALRIAGPEARLRAERWLLLNPFLIFLAGAWGMFDAIMMALLLASVLLLELRRPALAGLAFAASALTKLFPVLVAPLLFVYAWRKLGRRAALVATACAVALGALVCLPFLVATPEGFVSQTLGMHLARPAQGFALASFPTQVSNLDAILGWSIPVPPASSVIAAAAALFLVVLVLVWAQAPRAKDPGALLALMLAVFVGALVLNKVVNEQYLTMPVALLGVLVASGQGKRWHARAFAWGGLASAILVGFHFVTLVPADVALRLGLPRPDELVAALSRATGLPILVVVAIPHLLAVAALVPALVAALQLVAPPVRASAAALARKSRRAAPLVVALLVLAPPIAGAVLALPPEPQAREARPELRLVLARYDLAIANPQHDPAVRDGFWARGPYPEPASGYYDASAGRLREDLRAMHAAGVDVVVATADAGNRVRFDALLEAADAEGMRAAPAVDLAALGACPAAQRLFPRDVPPADGALHASPTTQALASSCIRDALRPFASHPAALRVGGKPALFVLNASLAPDASWLDAGRSAFLVASIAPGAARPSWADAAYVAPPQRETMDAFLASTRERLASDALPIAAAFDATWTTRGAWDASWQAAQEGHASWVVVAWNLHREGSALERVAGGEDWAPRLAARAEALK